MRVKEEYSEEEIRRILEKIKPKENLDMELRLQRLENDLRVAFLAMAQLKSELNSVNLIIGKAYAPSEVQAEKFKKVSESMAEKMIKEYISRNPGCRTSEIIFNLKIHPDSALKILKKLRGKGKIRSEQIERGK